jgi:hypothetical protein
VEDDFILRQIRLLNEGVAKVVQLAPVAEAEEAHDQQDGGEPPAPDPYARSAATSRHDVAARDDRPPSQALTPARRAAGHPPTSAVVALVFVASTWLRACGC